MAKGDGDLLAVAVANGALTVAVLIPRLGDYPADVVSTLMLSILIAIVAWLTTEWMQVDSARSGLAVGALWVACTLAFEFVVGHYVFRSSWQKLLAEYHVHNERIWVLVLVVTFFAPLWAFSQRHPV